MSLHHFLDLPRFLIELLNGKKAAAERGLAKRRCEDLAGIVDFSRSLSVLDLANGALCPQYFLLESEGHRVVGVDLVNRPEQSVRSVLYRCARFLFRFSLGAVRIPPRRLVCADVTALPFPDASFDLVTSVAAFEHFLDVPGVLEEAHRVLKPGGAVWAAIHVFTTLSGGHNAGRCLGRPLPKGIEPWDHLRKRRLPFTVPLNEWRIADYVAAFSSRFDLVRHGPAGSEGASLLTPEILAELSDYSAEELTCEGYFIAARKR